MNAHVLSNILNDLKSDKMRGLPSILSLFRNEFNKFNNTKVSLFSDIEIALKWQDLWIEKVSIF